VSKSTSRDVRESAFLRCLAVIFVLCFAFCCVFTPTWPQTRVTSHLSSAGGAPIGPQAPLSSLATASGIALVDMRALPGLVALRDWPRYRARPSVDDDADDDDECVGWQQGGSDGAVCRPGGGRNAAAQPFDVSVSEYLLRVCKRSDAGGVERKDRAPKQCQASGEWA
jgi:hypothetical protein